jgi:hypothetical protein
MRRQTFAAILSSWLLGVTTLAHADGPGRLLASAHALGGRPSEAASAGDGRSRALRLTNSGSAAESIVCLTFDRRESQRAFRVRGAHVYACFNLLRDPAEAVGAVLDRRGRAQCVVTGSFRQGATAAEDCLILALCGDVFVTGAC